jgi:hypothetical protein
MARKALSIDTLSREDAQRFADDGIRELLDALGVDELVRLLGEPASITEYATAPGWSVGDGQPTLANDDPAVMQAIGRCAANRARRTFDAPMPMLDKAHPTRCDWCDFPQDELLKACSWAVHQSRFVLADVLVWTNDEGHRYVRSGNLTGYQNPRWRRFFEDNDRERERQIAVATGRELVEAGA